MKGNKRNSWLILAALAFMLLGMGRQKPKGDVNGDGVVDMGDVIALERIIAGVDPVNPRADVNGDGAVNQLDIAAVERIIMGL